MAVLDKNVISMSMPKAMSRGNPIALDASAVWYTYAELENYAKTSPVAYVGQILSLVDEEQQTATAYIITGAAGTLQKIGTGSGAAVQWPVFAGSLKHIIKGLGNGGSRYAWWCQSSCAGSAAYFANVSGGGLPDSAGAAAAWLSAPLCFLFV